MKAIAQQRYGGPAELRQQDIEKPQPAADQVLIRVEAVSLNPLDWHVMTGTPYFMRLQMGLRRPKRTVPGVDVAGTVEALGDGVTRFQVGDRVFGGAVNGLAEYVVATEDSFALIPEGLSPAEAATVGVAAFTALQGLRDHGGLQAGEEVLINGAAGGVGTFAVQIAKAMGATVTAVCSSHNVEMVGSIGADRVVDYTKDDFAAAGRQYDLILDNVGNRSLRSIRKTLKPEGRYVMVSGPKKNRLLGPVGRVMRALAYFRLRSQTAKMFVAEETDADRQVLAEMVRDGQVVPAVEREFEFADAPEAMAYLGGGHARAKLVVTV